MAHKRGPDGDTGDLERQARSDKDTVRQFYNTKPKIDLHTRGESRIYQLRQFNNFIKSVLIGRYCRQGDCVFDICCGKGIR
jgi:mRNA (guanine-N7-)-methyltransferase